MDVIFVDFFKRKIPQIVHPSTLKSKKLLIGHYQTKIPEIPAGCEWNVAATNTTNTQYRLLYTISNSIEKYEEPVPRRKKIPHHAVKFEAGEGNRIV